MGAMRIRTGIDNPAQSGRAAGSRRRSTGTIIATRPSDWLLRLVLIILLSLAAAALAYQAPATGQVRVGWLGDQLFLDSSGGLGAAAEANGDFYIDDLTPDSPTGRSRWTRQHARIILPNIGSGADYELSLRAQGWPTDVVDPAVPQPMVRVLIDGSEVGTFTPEPTWETYRFLVPATVRQSADFQFDVFASHTFTDTERGPDARPKGIRLAEVAVRALSASDTMLLPPAWDAVVKMALATLLMYALLARLFGSTVLAFVFAALGAGIAAVGLTMLRIWMGAALNVVLLLLVLALLLAWWRPLLQLCRELLRRYSQGYALSYGLVAAALAWLSYVLARASQTYRWPGLGMFREGFPDSLLYGMLSVGLLALALVLGREGLPQVSNGISRLLGGPRAAPIMLLLLSGIWLGYQASIIAALPYAGHADYSDNAVVARNLVAGRGWTVDYVTQFYRLYDGVTRPQETWPLLQPVWIAPFFLLFGPESWAAKLPNLLFNLLLILLIYQVGARIWDRRVGLTAAVLTLTTIWFFNLTIFVTSDLAFVVFSMAAIFLLYQWDSGRAERRSRRPGWLRAHGWLITSGVLTGLMMLQKPSGAIIAVGMGLWLVVQVWWQSVAEGFWRRPFYRLTAVILAGLVWSLPALVVLSPYLVRNMVLFGKPVYSTESHDAWVLGYRGTSSEAWEDIYRVFAPELGGPGVPDRSWILRWGFDYTFAKFQTQIVALRDYLVPPWAGLPDSLEMLSSRLSDSHSRSLLTPLGNWLALIGLIAALRARRRLLALLCFAFLPYMLFMSTYWRTNEERYWVMLIPWLALLAAWMIWAGFDRLARIGDGRWSPLGLILVGVAVVSIVQPSWAEIDRKLQTEPPLWQADLIAYAWLAENTEPGTVIMARNPWQLNWHSRRPALMIPNTADRELLLELADHYDAEYLILENLLRIKSDAAENLAPLIAAEATRVGDTVADFELVYASPTEDQRVFIYRLPAENR
jgi:4-amino-4-deoxy-L-arabinose transferase-like glycosyltransferase